MRWMSSAAELSMTSNNSRPRSADDERAQPLKRRGGATQALSSAA
jgi:hypothetical protein